MSQALDFIGVLLHTFGLIIFGGGLVWVMFFMINAQKSKKPHGKAFMPEVQPKIGKLLTLGILLLLSGGLIRMISLDKTGFWGDIGEIWGISMVIKHILFVVVFIVGLIMVFKLTPTTLKLAPKGPGEKPSPEFLKYVGISQKMGMINVMLGMIIIVLSVVAVTL